MGNELLQICGIAILCAVSALLLRVKSSEFATLLRVAGILLIVGMILWMTQDVLASFDGVLDSGALGEYATVMLKAIGIALLCSTCGNICRDCGENTLASGVEIAGNLMILSLSLPLIEEILGYAAELLSME